MDGKYNGMLKMYKLTDIGWGGLIKFKRKFLVFILTIKLYISLLDSIFLFDSKMKKMFTHFDK